MAITDELKDIAQLNRDIHVFNIGLPQLEYEPKEQAQASIPKFKSQDEDGYRKKSQSKIRFGYEIKYRRQTNYPSE